MRHMASKKPSKIEGFYAAYFTGVMGSTLGMLVFRDGIVVGADAGGGRYDGTYKSVEDDGFIEGVIKFGMPIGAQSITGAAATSEPLSINVPIKFPTEFNRNDVHTIQTPIGAINAKFEKIRGI